MTAGLFLLVVAVAVIYGIWQAYEAAEPPRPGEAQPVTKTERDAQIICPHCQTKGLVTTRRVKLKKGISGGKAVGALMTAGVSVLATGLSRKEAATEAKCSNCGSIWHF
jgi:DNA-directed RNA polymerase subunit RPC12/RpoP